MRPIIFNNTFISDKDKIFSSYRQNSSVFFECLKSQSNSFNAHQFQLYRDNFLYRTRNTLGCVEKLVRATKINHDAFSQEYAEKNYEDEMGNGWKSHQELLQDSHSIHSEIVFKIPRILLEDVDLSPFILEATKSFSDIQNKLYSDDRYIVVLATSYAQESVAQEMLSYIYNYLFKPYEGVYAGKGCLNEFEYVSSYFLCHTNGLEEKHAEHAETCLIQNCKSYDDYSLAVQSIKTFLDAQQLIWIELTRRMNK